MRGCAIVAGGLAPAGGLALAGGLAPVVAGTTVGPVPDDVLWVPLPPLINV